MKKILMILSLSFGLLMASEIGIGTSINTLGNYKFETPHGRQMKVPKSSKLVVVAFEKDTGKLVNNFLESQDVMYMPKKRAIFIADIHNMPSIITNMFALPKLQKYKHLIYLHYDDEFENFIPHKDEMVTLIRFKDKKVESISFISNEEELKAEIEK